MAKEGDCGMQWSKFLERVKVVPPSSYLAIDLEYTSNSPENGLALEVGFALVDSGEIKSSSSAKLNWFDSGLLDADEIEKLDARISYLSKVMGPSWVFDRATVQSEGKDPVKILKLYSDLISSWVSKGGWLVAQSGITADEPVLKGNLKRFLGVDFSFPENYFDVGLYYKACKIFSTAGENYSLVSLGSDRMAGYEYFKALSGLRLLGCTHNREEIEKNLGLEKVGDHTAKNDSIFLHNAIQKYFSFLNPFFDGRQSPEEFAEIKAKPKRRMRVI